MAWVRIDDSFSEHPKWGNADAFQVQWFVYALCYCNRNLTDGFIPYRVAHRLTDHYLEHYPEESEPYHVCRLLLQRGVLQEDQERCGYYVVGYLDYQPSKAEVLRDRNAAAKRMGRWRNTHSNGVTDGVTDGVSNGVTDGVSNGASSDGVTPAPNPNPNPKKREKKVHVSPDGETPADFLEFWGLYPRKEAKKDALKAWRQVHPENGTLEAILANVGTRKQSDDWMKDGGRYVPLPASYLRGQRWEDQAVVSRGVSSAPLSAKELNAAKAHYAKLGSRCHHEPTCETWQGCVRLIAERQRGLSSHTRA
jgi:hypothetical protein